MSIDTHIDGDPESVRQVAHFLRHRLAPVVQETADSVFAARNRIDAAWDGPASELAVPKLTAAADGGLTLSAAAVDHARRIDEFADALHKAQDMMATARRDAAAAGLTVVGDVIEEPSSGDLSAAYERALDSADAARTAEREAAETLADVWTNPYVDWLFLAGEFVDAAVTSVVEVQVGSMVQKAAWLVSESHRYLELARNAPAGTPASVVYRDLDYASTTATRAIDVLDSAENLASKAGRVSGALGAGLTIGGVAWDVYNGKPVDQAVVSAGASFAASVAAGAAIGTLIPAPILGTAVGAVGGAIVGIFTSGAVDTLYEDGIGSAGDAVVDGWDALYDTGASIGELATGAWDVLF